MLGGAVAPAPGSPTRAQLGQLLSTVSVLDTRPNPPGYDRNCTTGHGCVFGPAWTDDNDAAGGHDGCDTRNNVLAAQLTEVVFRDRTHNCIVVRGTLFDNYTGKRIAFTKQNASAVQIDHVYPLAAAWDMGAANWPIELRTRFANDVEFNLLAVDGQANQSKSDKTPGRWLPPNKAYHCFYAGKFVTAASRYHLPVTRSDHTAIARIAQNCGGASTPARP